MKRLLVCFLPIILSCKIKAQNEVVVSSIDQKVYTQGRVSQNKDGSSDFAYSGVSFEIRTNSSLVKAVFEDLSGPSNSNYFNVIVDDSIVSVLKIGDKKETYLLASGLDSTVYHQIKVFKRTEAFVGASKFHGFVITSTSGLKEVSKPKKKLLLIGDSFSCGYGNLVSIAAPPKGNPSTGFDPKNEDNYWAWGAIAARERGVDYQCVAYSGRGMYRNNTGDKSTTMPKVFDLVNPDEPNGNKWKHKNYTPDVIVIKLGTNDFMYEAFQNIPVDSSEYVDTYVSFIKRLNGLYPNAAIVCVAGGLMSDVWPEGKFALTRIKRMISEVVTISNKEVKAGLCHYLELPTHNSFYGEDWHPTKDWHEKYAFLLSEKLIEVLR